MDVKILEKKEAQLLSRTEIIADVGFTGATPSVNAVKQRFADDLKVDQNLVVVKQILTKFGSSSAKIRIYAYKNKEAMEKVEPKSKKKKEKPAEAPAEAPKAEEKKEAPKEAPKEEKKEEPKEEKKEEKPAEEKKKGGK